MVFVKEMPLTAVGSGLQGYIPVGLRWPDEAPHLTSPHTAVRVSAEKAAGLRACPPGSEARFLCPTAQVSPA